MHKGALRRSHHKSNLLIGVCACSGRALAGGVGGFRGSLLALVAADGLMASFIFWRDAVTYLFSLAGTCKHSQIFIFTP